MIPCGSSAGGTIDRSPQRSCGNRNEQSQKALEGRHTPLIAKNLIPEHGLNPCVTPTGFSVQRGIVPPLRGGLRSFVPPGLREAWNWTTARNSPPYGFPA